MTTERLASTSVPARSRRETVWAVVLVASVPLALLTWVLLARTVGPDLVGALPADLSTGSATALGAACSALPVVLATLLLLSADGGWRWWARVVGPALVWWAASAALLFPGRSGTGSVVEEVYGDLAPTVEALGTGFLLALACVVGAGLVAGVVVTLTSRAPADLARWSPQARRERGRAVLRRFGWTFLVLLVLGVATAGLLAL